MDRQQSIGSKIRRLDKMDLSQINNKSIDQSHDVSRNSPIRIKKSVRPETVQSQVSQTTYNRVVTGESTKLGMFIKG